MKIKTSVILSARNCRSYISKSIDSILNQSYKDFELVVVDDNSSDGTYEILKKYSKLDKRIKIYRNQKKLGLAASLNRALEYSNGDYIFRMDGDDIAVRNRLDIQLSFMIKNPQIILSGGGAYIIDDQGKIIKQHTPGCLEVSHKDLLKKNQLYHPTIVFKNNNDIYYRDKFIYSQDYDLYLRLSEKGYNIANIKDPVIYYRISHSAERRRKGLQQHLFSEEARKSSLSRLNNKKDSYLDLNVKIIISYDFENTNDRKIAYLLIKECIKSNNFNLAIRYFFKHLSKIVFSPRIILLIALFIYHMLSELVIGKKIKYS